MKGLPKCIAKLMIKESKIIMIKKTLKAWGGGSGAGSDTGENESRITFKLRGTEWH